MRVTPHAGGWDIALDYSFTDKLMAERVATYLEATIHALVRDAVGSVHVSPSDHKRCGHLPKEEPFAAATYLVPAK